MQLFAALAIMVVSYLLSALTKPKSHPQEAKPALDADIVFPQPDEGTKKAVIFGEAWVPNWAVLWHGNYRAYPVQDHGTTIGYMYSYSMLMGLCQGPINEILEMQVGGRTIYRPADGDGARLIANGTFGIDKATLFGGTPNGQGGIVAQGYFLNGAPDQVLPATMPKQNAAATAIDIVPMSEFMPGARPAYRGVATLLVDGYVSYNSTNPQPWAFSLRRHTAGWDGATWYPEKAVIVVNSGEVVIPNPQLSDPNIDDDTKRTLARTVTVIRNIECMNPVHVLIEGMTNRTWGRGLTLDQINLASYQDAADIAYNEGLGLATKWDRSGPLSDFMQTVIDYLGATQYPDPVSGKVTLKLVRGDYNAATIPTFTYGSGLMSVKDNSTAGADSTVNQMVVTYTSPVTGKKGQVRAQNLALFTALGSVIQQSKTYDCVPNADLAKRIAGRDLKAASSGLRRLKLEMDRSAWSVVPGSVIKVTGLTDHKIDSMVLRVGKVTKANGTSGNIVLDCVQDVFAFDSTEYAYTVDTQPAWKPPVPGDTAVVPAPPLVSNLHLVRPWDGKVFEVAWDRGDDASYYDVQVYAPTIDKVVRFRTHVMDNTFSYSVEDMIADGGPWRSIEVQVRAVSYTHGTGPWFKQGLYNPQVAALTGIQVTEAMRQAFFQYNRPVEADWVGTLVYISDTPGFVPSGENQVYDGVDLFVTLTQLADGTLLKSGTDYYLRAAGYDNFGKDSLNYSSEVVFSVVANAPDANSIVADMIQDGALEVSKFARTIAPPLIVNGVPSLYAGSDVILDQKTNKLYRWDATAGAYTSATDAADIAGTIPVETLPQITTDLLVGLIPTTQLSGQITTGQISANAIGADQIAAGAIIAGKLAAGAVQAGNLTANAVTAGTIAAGAVGANEIASKSISADKLLVGDMTNQVDDPDFSLGDMRSWTTADTTNWSVDSTTAGIGADGSTGVLVAKNFGTTANRTIDAANTRFTGVSKGDVWYAAVQGRLSAADTTVKQQIVISAFDANKVLIESVVGSVTNVTAYTTISAQYQVTNPAVKFVQVGLRVNTVGTANASTQARFDNVQMLRMSSAVLIQDGSISAQKITAATITGDKLVANTITGDRLVANTITAAQIAANTITAAQIAAGSISADKLMVGSSPNLITDPGWLNGVTFWGVPGGTGYDFSQNITGSNEKVLTVYANTSAGAYIDSQARPVVAGNWYMGSVYGINAATTGCYTAIYFLDGSGNLLGFYQTALGGGSLNGRIDGMPRVWVKAQAPVGSSRVIFRCGVNAGSAGTGGFFYHPQVEECFANQAGPGPWGAAINTIIGPGNISTGSLSAISANLGYVTAGALNINNNFIVASDGTCLIRSAASGQRLEIDQNGVRQYYSNGNLAVRMGQW